MIKPHTYRFESSDKEKITGNPEKSIIGDIRKFLKGDNNLLKGWKGERLTRRLHPDGTIVGITEKEVQYTYTDEDGNEVKSSYIDRQPEPHGFISGNRLDIIPLRPEVLEPAEFDEDGNVTKEAVLSNIVRYDVRMPEYRDKAEQNTRKPEKDNEAHKRYV